MSNNNLDYFIRTRRNIIDAGKAAIEELLEVAKEKIIKPKENDDDFELSADRLKNAAAAKKMAVMDAFEILKKIEDEEDMLDELINGDKEDNSKGPRSLVSGRAREKR